MADRNSESYANQIVIKQAYLRDHIPQDKYEDFAQFCEALTKSIDIQSWSFEYVRELVQKFKKSQQDKQRNKKKTGPSFHLYQTGNTKQMKNLADKIRQQKQERYDKEGMQNNNRNENKAKNNQADKNKQQKSALQVLDSIFENHHVSEYQTKKYDKAFFQSCKFWEVPGEQTKQKQKDRSPVQNKAAHNNQAIKFTSNNLPIQPQNFDKMFQTGLNLEVKNQKSPKKVFVQIPLDQEPKKAQSNKPQHKVNMNKNKKEGSTDQSNQKKQIKLVSVKNIRNSKGVKVPYEGQTLVKQPFKDTVACFKSFVRHALSVQHLKIEIINHQIINRSFFSSNYPMFHLKVMPANIICKRNFQDFQKLQRNLQSVYPGVRLPYLQKLKWLQSQVSPQYIEKQKKYLGFFLQDVLQHEDLKNSRILQDFLTLKDHKQMKRKFEQYDKIKKITSIQELCLIQGQVKVQISETNRQYNEYLQSFLSKMKFFWSNQQRILSQISEMHIKLSENYRDLHTLIEEITKETKQFNKRVNINEIEFLQDAFQNLTNYVAENIKVNQKQSQFLQKQVLVYLRYEKQNMNMFDSVISNQNYLTKCYLKRKDSEKSNDNLEFLSERLKDYKVDILQQSKNITVLKYQCGYINNLLTNEGYRYFRHLSAKMQKLISDICYSKLSYLSKSIDAYTALVYA